MSVDSGANSTHTEVSSNYVEGGSGAGSGWQPNGIQVTNDSYILIEHNVIIDPDANCIALTPSVPASHVEILDNACTGAGFAKTGTGSMDGIVVFASTSRASESNLSITGNQVQGSQQYGIVIGGVSGLNTSNFHDIIVACNQIVGYDQISPGTADGIRIVGQRITMTNNLVDALAGANHRYGINIDLGSGSIIAAKNTVVGSVSSQWNNTSGNPILFTNSFKCPIQ